MQTRNLVLFIASSLVLGGCATMSGDECRVSDWRSIGYEDGVKGYSGDRIGNHRKACAKHGVTPDMQEYQAGRAEGLKEFCQPQNGFRVGARGGSYSGVCPADLEDDFFDAYQTGRQLYTLESSVRSATSQIATKERRMKEIDEELAAIAVEMISSTTTSERRVLLLVETKSLAEEQGKLEAEIKDLVAAKARHEIRLAEYREAMPRFY